MQSISAPSIHIVPTVKSDDTDGDVMRLENLLNQIFGDELDLALSTPLTSTTASSFPLTGAPAPSTFSSPSNLVEFPLVNELIALQKASLEEQAVQAFVSAGTLDFSPEAFDLSDPVLETDLTRFTPSIIGSDDFDGSHLQLVIDAQQQQMVNLREQVKQRDFLIRCHTVDLAAKDDQLKYMPELLDKALQMATVDAANQILHTDLAVEKLVNEELHRELTEANAKLGSLNNHLLVKFARVIGLINQ